MFNRVGRLVVALAASLLVPSFAVASSVIAQSLEELTGNSTVVVRGTVGAVQANWDEGQTKIWTHAEVKVAEVLKGQASPSILVKQPGGIVGNLGQSVAGVAKFAPGQDCVLFLEPAADEKGVFIVVGLGLGKIDLMKNKQGVLKALRNSDGLVLYDRTTGLPAKIQRVGAGPEDFGTPAELLARIKAAVESKR